MGAQKTIEVDIGGKKYAISSDDDYLNHIKDGFRPDMVRLFKILAMNSRVILDIGANIGCTTILFSELANHVWAFEPSSTTWDFLKENTARLRKKNISVQTIGFGIKKKTTTITFSPSNRSGAFISDQIQLDSNHVVEEAKIDRLDDVVQSLDLKDIDFIKIDVEGYEPHVLKGGIQTIKANQPVVVLRLNHWCLNVFQRTSILDFLDLLRSIFPVLLAVDGSNYMNLHKPEESYFVMHQNVIHMRYNHIIAAFSEAQLGQFRMLYTHG